MTLHCISSDTENVKWRIKIPGKGNSTPVIWGDTIFVTTAVPTEPIPEAAAPGRGGRPGGPGGPPGARGGPEVPVARVAEASISAAFWSGCPKSNVRRRRNFSKAGVRGNSTMRSATSFARSCERPSAAEGQGAADVAAEGALAVVAQVVTRAYWSTTNSW